MKRNIQLLASAILLLFSLAGCGDKMGRLDVMWTRTESPLFPTEWPPTANTTWVSYEFAYGSSLTLMDGVYVSAPLSRTEWKAGGKSTTVLNKKMKEAGTQGVFPMADENTRLILENEAALSQFCLGLTSLPALDSNGTKEMLSFYNAWFGQNGTFLDLIRGEHVGFIDWVLANP